MEPEGSLPPLEEPATCSFPKPNQFSPYPHIPLPEYPSKYYPPNYAWAFQVASFPSGFPTKTLYTPLSSPTRTTCPAHLVLLDFITRKILGQEYRSFCFSLCSFLFSPVTSFLGQIFSSAPYSQTPSVYVPPSMWTTTFRNHTIQETKLYLCVPESLYFWIVNKNSEPNDSTNFLTSICS